MALLDTTTQDWLDLASSCYWLALRKAQGREEVEFEELDQIAVWILASIANSDTSEEIAPRLVAIAAQDHCDHEELLRLADELQELPGMSVNAPRRLIYRAVIAAQAEQLAGREG